MTRHALQYELLRTQVIGTVYERAGGREAQPLHGIGLALLLRDGMPGWLTAVETVLRASFARPPPERSLVERMMPAALPSVLHHDITILLTSLVLSTRGLTGLSPNEGYPRPC